MRLCVCRLTLVTLAVSFVAQQAAAELPPGSYVKLRKSAPIVLNVRITKTAAEEDDVAALHRVACTATIEAVERAPEKTPLKADDTVAFDAYYLSSKAAQRGFAGPRWPHGACGGAPRRAARPAPPPGAAHVLKGGRRGQGRHDCELSMTE